MPVGKNRLRLKSPTTQCQPHAVVADTRLDRAWLDKVTSHRYTCCTRFPGGVSMWGLRRKGGMVQKPEDHLTLNAEDGEALIARVHCSNLPRADAERVEWVIRMYFYVVFALQEAKLSVKRLRALLFGKCPEPSPSPEASSAAAQADSDGPHVSAVLKADADGAGATGNQAPPGAAPRPE